MSNIALEAIKLSHSARLELYVLDLTPLGGAIHRFAPYTNELGQAVTWQGHQFTPMPIQATGFKRSASGAFPRPRLSVSNVLGSLQGLVRQYGNLLGARITRKGTHARFLDAVNFAAGNAQADPLAEYPDEIWQIDRTLERNHLVIAWELVNPVDLPGVLLPGRTAEADYCQWVYRSSDCGYSGPAVAKIDDSPTTDLAHDRCSQRLSGCRLRYPHPQLIPASFFPGLGKQRQV